MSALSELRERVERATGPDRELDAEIAACVDGGEPFPVPLSFGRHEWKVRKLGRTHDGYDYISVALLTASIDAALALVERKLPDANTNGLEGDGLGGWDAYVSRNHVASGHWYFEGSHKHPAIAILSALLRALESQEAPNG